MSKPSKLQNAIAPSYLSRSKSTDRYSFSTRKGTNPQMQTKLQQILQPKVIKVFPNSHNARLNSADGFAKNRSSMSLRIKSGLESPATTLKGGQTPIQSLVIDQHDIVTPENVSRPGSKKKRVSIISSFDSAFGFNPAKPRNIMSSTISTNFTNKANQKESKELVDDLTSATPSLQNTTSQYFFRPKENPSFPIFESRVSSPDEGAERELRQDVSRKSSMHRKSSSLIRIGTAPQNARRKSSLERKPSLSIIQNIDLDLEQRLVVEEYFEEMLGFYYKQAEGSIKGRNAEERLSHIDRFLKSLLNQKRRPIILALIMMRKKIRKFFNSREVILIIEELTDLMFLAIQMSDIFLFLEVLHLIGDTYLMFGDIENTIFAYNQLRLACELVNDIPRKIKALEGLAEVAKRIFRMDEAIKILLKTLQYAWYANQRTTAMNIYDQLGLLFYHISDMERAKYYHSLSLSQGGNIDPGLIKIVKLEIGSYIEANHSNYQNIGMQFFSKLSLPHYRPGRIMTSAAKVFDFNFSIENRGSDKEESPLARLAKKSSLEVFYDSRATSEMARFSTTIPANVQLETLMNDQEFSKLTTSPSTFQTDEGTKFYKTSKSFQKEEHFLQGQLKKVNEHTTNKKEDYSLKKLFGDRIPLKDINKKIEQRLKINDSEVDFWTIKKQLLNEYKTSGLNGRMFFNHLSPNRNVMGFRNAFEFSFTRFSNFFKIALERSFVSNT